MADLIELTDRMINLETQFAAFQAAAKTPAQLTGSERKLFENALYPLLNGYRARKSATNSDYTNWEVGDQIIEINSSNKMQIVGEVISVPFNPSTDIEDSAKFDLYKNDSPAL